MRLRCGWWHGGWWHCGWQDSAAEWQDDSWHCGWQEDHGWMIVGIAAGRRTTAGRTTAGRTRAGIAAGRTMAGRTTADNMYIYIYSQRYSQRY